MPSHNVKGDASSQDAGVKERDSAGSPDDIGVKNAPESLFKPDEIVKDQPLAAAKHGKEHPIDFIFLLR